MAVIAQRLQVVESVVSNEKRNVVVDQVRRGDVNTLGSVAAPGLGCHDQVTDGSPAIVVVALVRAGSLVLLSLLPASPAVGAFTAAHHAGSGSVCARSVHSLSQLCGLGVPSTALYSHPFPPGLPRPSSAISNKYRNSCNPSDTPTKSLPETGSHGFPTLLSTPSVQKKQQIERSRKPPPSASRMAQSSS